MGSAIALFTLTLRQTLLRRKILGTVLLLLVPSLLVLLVGGFAPDPSSWELAHLPLQYLVLTVALPLVTMLYGTALIGADVEGRTIGYLITRRLRRHEVLIVRFLATALALSLLIALAAAATFACAVLVVRGAQGGLSEAEPAWNPWADLMHYLWVTPLAVTAFLGVFSFIGLATARAQAVSVVYFVIFELIVGWIPADVQKYTMLHQVRATLARYMPAVREYLGPPANIEALYPLNSTGVVPLIVVSGAALGLSCLLMTCRELVPAKISRD